jgi:transposase
MKTSTEAKVAQISNLNQETVLRQNPALKDWMKEQLEGWRTKALRYEEEQSQLRRRIEALAPESCLPKGVGRYSWAVLEYEMKGWARFHNRGQVSSYTGLCPGVHRSDNRGKEGSINRCGNPIVRWILIEMVWRLGGLAARLSTDPSVGQRPGALQTSQETLGGDGGAPFGDRSMALGYWTDDG